MAEQQLKNPSPGNEASRKGGGLLRVGGVTMINPCAEATCRKREAVKQCLWRLFR